MADPVNHDMRVNVATANRPRFATIPMMIGRPERMRARPLAEARRTS